MCQPVLQPALPCGEVKMPTKKTAPAATAAAVSAPKKPAPPAVVMDDEYMAGRCKQVDPSLKVPCLKAPCLKVSWVHYHS